jgi:hypothetical protein
MLANFYDKNITEATFIAGPFLKANFYHKNIREATFCASPFLEANFYVIKIWKRPSAISEQCLVTFSD